MGVNTILLLSLLLLRVYADVPADEIKSLPGWSGPLPSRMFSGHIDGGSDVQDGVAYTMKMWYMYVECECADPSTAPTLLWSNGGPGASSAYGLFTELGPFTLSDQPEDLAAHAVSQPLLLEPPCKRSHPQRPRARGLLVLPPRRPCGKWALLRLLE